MSCGNTSCLDQLHIDVDGSAVGGSSIGFLQVMPEEFTREELQALLNKTRNLLNFTMLSDAKREFLECMAEDLDVLDAIAAREELDILEMTEAIRSDPQYVPHIRVEPVSSLPFCSHDCPFHPRIYG